MALTIEVIGADSGKSAILQSEQQDRRGEINDNEGRRVGREQLNIVAVVLGIVGAHRDVEGLSLIHI